MEAKTEKERGKKEKGKGKIKNREDLRNEKGSGGVEVRIVGNPTKGKWSHMVPTKYQIRN